MATKTSPKWLQAIIDKEAEKEWLNHNWEMVRTSLDEISTESCYDLRADDLVIDFIGLLIDEIDRLRDALANPCNFSAPCGNCEACKNVKKILK